MYYTIPIARVSISHKKNTALPYDRTGTFLKLSYDTLRNVPELSLNCCNKNGGCMYTRRFFSIR